LNASASQPVPAVNGDAIVSTGQIESPR
jgi:hypothetical protein